MKKVGLYFGSFNPIHIGHLIIADYFANAGIFDEVRLVVSPHNPLKALSGLASFEDRWAMTQLAINGHSVLSASDVESHLPQPSYTIDTLRYLREASPDVSFQVIMGMDSLLRLKEWKEYSEIIDQFGIVVFPRQVNGEVDPFFLHHPKIRLEENAPRIDISSTQIREDIKKGKSIRFRVISEVEDYIRKKGLYLI